MKSTTNYANDDISGSPRYYNISSTGFTVRYQPWTSDWNTYIHVPEDVHWLILEEGRYDITGSSRSIEAGKVTFTSNSARYVNFAATFPTMPVFISNIATSNDPRPINTRNDNVATHRARITPQFLPIYGGALTEEVHWFASEQGSDAFPHASRCPGNIDNNWVTCSTADLDWGNVAYIIDSYTLNGGDPTNIQMRNVQRTSFEARLLEDTSTDPEQSHTTENMNWAAFTQGEAIFNHRCECFDGYNGQFCHEYACNGTGASIDTVCSSHGACVAPDNCTCHVDYLGDNCQFHYCYGVGNNSNATCSGHGVCSSPHHCDCEVGWAGNNCDIPICFGYLANDTQVCSRHGNCTYKDTCACEYKYYGSECFITICNGTLSNDTSTCSNHGECIAPEICNCTNTYNGSYCQHPYCNGTLADVATVCSSHGTCYLPDKCNCFTGYMNTYCDIPICFDIHANDSSVCSTHGQCILADTCQCDTDWGFTNCSLPYCFSILANNESVCHGHGTCVSNNTCVCEEGYMDNECQTPICFNIAGTNDSACDGHGECILHDTCVCEQFYHASDCSIPSCYGVMANESTVCSTHGNCYSPNNCSCYTTHDGFNCQFPICDGISSNDSSVCSTHGICWAPEKCNCTYGYANTYCNIPICFDVLANDSAVCSTHGDCLQPDTCSCDEDWGSSNCSKPFCFSIRSDNSLVCTGHGSCISNNTCSCVEGYTDIKCDIPICQQIRADNTSVCSSHGSCMSFDNCSCVSFYHSEDCSIPSCYSIWANNQSVCSSHGSCLSPQNCSCDEGYTGPECEFNICNSISSNSSQVCSTHGTCTQPDVCECNYGYHGIFCQQHECFGILNNDSSVCSTHGVCQTVHQCQCVPTYTGDNCSFPICFDIPSNETTVCTGHGKCILPDECDCDSRFSGFECNLDLFPFAILSSPKQIGPCNDLLLDGTRSFYTQGNKSLTYHWTLKDSNGVTIVPIESKPIVSIPVSHLVGHHLLYVTFRVRDGKGSYSDLVERTIKRSNTTNFSSMIINGPEKIHIYRRNKITIGVTTIPSTCENATSIEPIITWHSPNLPMLQVNGYEHNFPSYYFPIGTYQINMESNQGAFHNISVIVHSAPLEARLFGGSYIQHPINKNLIFDATKGSFDPDLSLRSIDHLSFHWSCVSCGFNFVQGYPIQTILPTGLTQGKHIYITLTVTDGTRVSKASQHVELMPSTVLNSPRFTDKTSYHLLNAYSEYKFELVYHRSSISNWNFPSLLNFGASSDLLVSRSNPLQRQDLFIQTSSLNPGSTHSIQYLEGSNVVLEQSFEIRRFPEAGYLMFKNNMTTGSMDSVFSLYTVEYKHFNMTSIIPNIPFEYRFEIEKPSGTRDRLSSYSLSNYVSFVCDEIGMHTIHVFMREIDTRMIHKTNTTLLCTNSNSTSDALLSKSEIDSLPGTRDSLLAIRNMIQTCNENCFEESLAEVMKKAASNNPDLDIMKTIILKSKRPNVFGDAFQTALCNTNRVLSNTSYTAFTSILNALTLSYSTINEAIASFNCLSDIFYENMIDGQSYENREFANGSIAIYRDLSQFIINRDYSQELYNGSFVQINPVVFYSLVNDVPGYQLRTYSFNQYMNEINMTHVIPNVVFVSLLNNNQNPLISTPSKRQASLMEIHLDVSDGSVLETVNANPDQFITCMGKLIDGVSTSLYGERFNPQWTRCDYTTVHESRIVCQCPSYVNYISLFGTPTHSEDSPPIEPSRANYAWLIVLICLFLICILCCTFVGMMLLMFMLTRHTPFKYHFNNGLNWCCNLSLTKRLRGRPRFVVKRHVEHRVHFQYSRERQEELEAIQKLIVKKEDEIDGVKDRFSELLNRRDAMTRECEILKNLVSTYEAHNLRFQLLEDLDALKSESTQRPKLPQPKPAELDVSHLQEVIEMKEQSVKRLKREVSQRKAVLSKVNLKVKEQKKQDVRIQYIRDKLKQEREEHVVKEAKMRKIIMLLNKKHHLLSSKK